MISKFEKKNTNNSCQKRQNEPNFVVFPAENWQKNAKFWVCLLFFDSKKQVISNFETLPV